MNTTLRKISLAIFLASLPLASLQAAGLTLNRSFGSHMVVQRDKPVLVRGTAEKGAKVGVRFAGQKVAATADDQGLWSVALAGVPANKTPQDLMVSSGSETITLNNVLVGDVFLHARQSSIDISLGRNEAGRKAAASHRANPLLRAMTIEMIPSAAPLHDLAAEATKGWAVVDGQSATKMTASAYHLGLDLAKDSDVPVGIIDIQMGPAFAQSWLSREALMETGKFHMDEKGRPDFSIAKKTESLEVMWEAEQKGEKLRPKDDAPPKDVLKHVLFPYAGYRGTLQPLAGTALKAVLLQLGNDYPYMLYQDLIESDDPFNTDALNKAYAETYDLRKSGFRMEDKVVPRVTGEWRKLLGDKDLPFGLIVPPGSDLHTLALHHREMRELQRLVAQDTPNVGIILPGTAHIPFSAQPADDALLAKRCAAWIQGAVLQKPGIPATGPMFEKMEAEYNEATIHFKPGTATGLKANGNALNYFEVAGVGTDYEPVKAVIDGEVIRLTSDTVTRITRARYNWNQQPNQELVNAAGLPAIPFRSERAPYEWFHRNEENDLPVEYSLPANEWPKNDVTLINVALEGKGYDNFTGWIGPAGFHTGPFGPNMGVREIAPGSPADGKLLVDDVIYSANGKPLGNTPWLVMADAVTESETREGKGRLVLGVRRGAENLEVELTLKVMGTYSPTAPYDCPKTEKVIDGVVKWIVERGGAEGRNKDFLGSDSIFLLATGNPEYLGHVRRAVYEILEQEIQPGPLDGSKVGKSWYNSAEAFLLGEYYLATGDRNVLPHLKYACDKLAAMQQPEGGWRHNYPGGAGYGYIAPAGLPGVMGMHFAKLAGCDINMKSYELGIHHFKHQRAETGQIIYGKGQLPRPIPRPLNPADIANGTVGSYNGAVSAAGILMGFVNDHRSAHLCSMISAYSFNHTHDGHGGNFWNNFWTPLGAHQHGKEAYIHFWKNYRWYHELSRMHDGTLIGGGRPTGGYGVALVAPRNRIQIVGAPPSPFAVDAPAVLKPALEAYWSRNYAACGKIIDDLMAESAIGIQDQSTAQYLARAAADSLASIDADLARMDVLINAGDPASAQAFLPGLVGVMAADDERLVAKQKRLDGLAELIAKGKNTKAIAGKTGNLDIDIALVRKMIEAGESDAAIAYIEDLQTGLGEEDKRLRALQDMAKGKGSGASATQQQEDLRQWACLVMEDGVPGKGGTTRGPFIKTPEQQPNLWKIKVVENMKQAPDGWSAPAFDDTTWPETTLPKSWRMYHTALLRTRFLVDDKERFDALRLHSWVMRQQEMEIHLNGSLIGKINSTENSAHIQKEFKTSALKYLKTGENLLAIKTRHNWRWGAGAMTVYNGGFDFNLDARLKP
jgi:sialate O-acetylesterase